MKNKNCLAILGVVCCFWSSGCSELDSSQSANYGVNPEYSVTKSALEAKCNAKLKLENGSYQTVSMETDYLPNVACCELPEAVNSEEAMQVQAIIGRSYAYATLGWKKYLEVNTNDQVYTCSWFNKTSYPDNWNKCVKGVKDTSGTVVYRKGSLLATYYRSGCPPQYLDSDCVYRGSVSGCNSNGVRTEKSITHNWGKSGSDVQTLYDDGDPAGCLSHNGTKCLAEKGWVSLNILKFFYGMDIELRQAEGSCVEVQKCENQLNGGETIIDDRDKCFVRTISENYFTVGSLTKSGASSIGYNGSLQFAYTTNGSASAVGTWRVNVKAAGDYEIYANVDSNVGKLSKKAVYKVRANGVEKSVTVDLSGKNGWFSLGRFKFAAGEDQWVKLTDATGEAYTDSNGTRIIFDALKFKSVHACTNQCSSSGAKECSDNGYRTCADSNGDGCLEWSADVACKNTEECRNGKCVEMAEICEDDCEEGATECIDAAGFRTCGQFNDDGCLEWSDAVACKNTEECRDGKCVEMAETCEDDCEEGATECIDENEFRSCGDFDDDSCLEWHIEACDSGLVCNRGECIDGIPENCLTEVSGKETVIDDLDACFVPSDALGWMSMSNNGYEEHLQYAYVHTGSPDAVGMWYLNVTQSGKYKISAYISGNVGGVKSRIEYTVKAGSLMDHPVITVSDNTNGWVDLGESKLESGALQYVVLSDLTDNPDEETNKERVIFDAIKVAPMNVSSNNNPDNDNNSEDTDASVDILSGAGTGCSVGGNPHHAFGLWMMLACFGGMAFSRRRKDNR